MLEPTLLLALLLPQTEAPPSPRERLEALIASTNELEHFSAEYSVEGSEVIQHIWIDYRAPRSIRLRMETPEGMLTWGLGNSIIWMHRPASGGQPLHGQVDLLDRGGACEEAIAVIRENGWNSTDGPEVELTWAWKFDTDRNKNDLDISVSASIAGSHDHTRLLGWLHNIEHLEGDLEVTGDALVHRSARAEAHIDRETGFLTRLALTTTEGSIVDFQLESVNLEDPPDDSCFVSPEPDRAAVDQSLSLRDRVTSRLYVRRSALRHVHNLLDKGTCQFNEELHANLERFFSALYDPKIISHYEDWVRTTKQDAIELSNWIHSERQAGHAPEHLESVATERRGELKATIDRVRVTLLQIIPVEIPNYPDSRHWHAIRDLEDKILQARFDELVGNPLLNDFDAHVDKALDR